MSEASFFDAAYVGQPPWDIGHPQQEFVRLAEAGEIKGDVLDAGCGTGENALYLALEGHQVWGVDFASRAIDKARAMAASRGIRATLVVGDALDLSFLDRQFDTVVDCGLFHVFSDAERPIYERSLREVLRSGGTYFMMCFSERESGTWGPRRVTRAEIRATFGIGWRVNYIREARFESNSGGAEAWLASIACQ